MSAPDPLLLGSASPRRRAILEHHGIAFEAVAPQVDEALAERAPHWTALENARRKQAWCRARFPGRHILTADTVVVFEDRCIAKPASLAEAHAFLAMFSGRSQEILTGLVYAGPDVPWRGAVVQSAVVFRTLTDSRIAAYFDRVDPLDKAGAYDIGQHGDMLIARWCGSYSNIMGLPAETVVEWLSDTSRTGTMPRA